MILKTQFNSKWPLFPEDEVVVTVEVVEVVASEVVVTAVDVEVASVEAVVTVAVAAVVSVVIAPDLDNLCILANNNQGGGRGAPGGRGRGGPPRGGRGGRGGAAGGARGGKKMIVVRLEHQIHLVATSLHCRETYVISLGTPPTQGRLRCPRRQGRSARHRQPYPRRERLQREACFHRERQGPGRHHHQDRVPYLEPLPI